MSNRNDEGMVWVLPVAIMAVTAVLVIIVVYVVAVVLSFLFTLLAFAAWNRPVTILDYTVKPEEARLFIGSGCVGIFVLPLIVLLFSAVFQFQVRPDLWGHFYVAGYAFGSLSVDCLAERAGIFKDPPAVASLPVQIVDARPAPQNAQEPFRFARWDDARYSSDMQSEASIEGQIGSERRDTGGSACLWRSLPLPGTRL